MQYAYASAVFLILALWIFLFIRRKDLRKEMLTMSLLASPLCLFDFWAVPLYWQPVTLFNIPVGIEGVLYSFCLGGIAAILYTEVARKAPQHMHKWHRSGALVVFSATLAVLVILITQGDYFNPAVMLYIALLFGIGVALYLRKDLMRGTVIGALCFGVVYFLLLKIWLTMFPGAINWFLFQGLPKVYVLGVPLWELLFGIMFAAYWGNVYELLFGYRLISKTEARKKIARKKTRN